MLPLRRMKSKHYQSLIEKIDIFIRWFYLDKLIKASLLLLGSLLLFYLVGVVVEYFSYLSTSTRTVLFYTYCLFHTIFFLVSVLPNLLAYYRLGKIITHEQAALIIGKHFRGVNDKLLNAIQLYKMSECDEEGQLYLIDAAIEQRHRELGHLRFYSAVKIEKNRRFLGYVLPILSLVVLLGVLTPYVLSEGTNRLIHHREHFQRKAPFVFHILNPKLFAVQGTDFELSIKISGSEIPQDIYLEQGEATFRLDKQSVTRFKFVFKNLQSNTPFRLRSGEFYSPIYHISVAPKPTLLTMNIVVEYPAYLKKKNEDMQNSGDLTVPEGTSLTWKLTGQDIDNLYLRFGERKYILRSYENKFVFNHRVRQNTIYSIIPKNKFLDNQEGVSYHIQVVKDESPMIQVLEQQDSTNFRTRFFVGEISDDYGFSKLVFCYRVANRDKIFKTQDISINTNARQTNFFHAVDFDKLQIDYNKVLEYEFVIYDNDGVNGAKATHSGIRTFKMPSRDELEKQLEANGKTIKQQTSAAIQLANQIDKDAKKLAQDLLGKKTLSYEERKQLEQLMKKQQMLEKMVQEVQQANHKNILENKEINQPSEEILSKQKQIEELYKNVLDEKTKSLLQDIQKMMDENNKGQTEEKLGEMQVDNKTLSKELDRILELYQQLEFDQKMENTLTHLEKIAQQQQQLAEETQKLAQEKESSHKKEQLEAIKNKQSELQKEFEKVKQELAELEKDKQKMDTPPVFTNPDKESDKIAEELKKTEEKLNENKEKEASEAQQKVAKKMEEMKEKIEEEQKKEEQKANKTNQKELKQLLKNLLNISFEQEFVMQSFRKIGNQDPAFVRMAQKQRDIKDNFKMVQDSLFSLSKRVSEMESTVNKETEKVNFNIDKVLYYVTDRHIGEILNYEQYALTSINNLALMINEVLEQMQNQSQGGGQGGSGGKGKGGNGKQSLSQLRKKQEQLNKNMQKAREEMQKGGGSSPLGKGGKNESLSKQMAKMAQQQQQIRNALQSLAQGKNKGEGESGGKQGTGKLGEGGEQKGEGKGEKSQEKGKGGMDGIGDLMREMEKTETELVNKKLSNEALMRQQEILTKLLEAENSQREQDEDKQRESKQGTDQAQNYQSVYKEFQRKKQREIELLRAVPPSLNSYYKIKVTEYFRKINSLK